MRGAMILAVGMLAALGLALAACSDDSGSSAAARAADAAESAADSASRAADAAEGAAGSASSAADRAGEAAEAAGAAAASAGEAADAAESAADSAASAAGAAASAAPPSGAGAAGDGDAGEITVYSGRSESLVGALIEQFEADTGVGVRVRYGGTAELAAAILEEGGRSPADVYYGQDAGALSALAEGGALAVLPSAITGMVAEEFRDAGGRWVGTSGRARVLIISPERVPDPPGSVFELVRPEWRGRVGWAPSNGSFQAFVTAMRQIHGDGETRAWLEGMIANGVREYPKNSPQVQAVGDGELDIGLVNHYYLFRFTAEDPDFPAANHFTDAGDAGELVNVAGVGLVAASEDAGPALRFIEYLLSRAGQEYFRDQTSEYPLASGVEPRPELTPLSELDPPSLALTSLSDLEGTLDLLRETGALP